jgi:hypothetical protein
LCKTQYLTDLKDWSAPITELKNLLPDDPGAGALIAGMSSMSVAPSSELTLPADPTPEAMTFYNQLMLLDSAIMHTKASKLQRIYSNLSFVACAVSFSSNAQWWAIKDTSVLETQMAKYVYHCVSQ